MGADTIILAAELIELGNTVIATMGLKSHTRRSRI